jgi:ornithine cyclodeaminase/alanine dehydrogenase-like protein (mu-crystallin family)
VSTTPLLVLGRQEVLDLLDMRALIDAVEGAQIEISAATAINPNRLRVFVPAHQAMLACMPAYLAGAGALGAKVVSSSSRAVAPGEPRPMSALVLLADTQGRFLSVMCGTQLGAFRTAAASAVAIRQLARDDAAVMAIIGCGVQGRAELAGAIAVRQITRVHVFDTDSGKAQAFAQEMAAQHGMAVVAEPSAEAAVRHAGIVALATTSTDPVFAPGSIQPGTHINAVGAHTPGTRELDSDTVAHARLFVESRAAILAEAGDVLIPIQEGRIAASHIVGELGDVAMGRVTGRLTRDDITIFKSTGIAVQDVIAAKLVYEAARMRGVGIEIAM